MSWDSSPVRPGGQRQGSGHEGNEMLLKAVRQQHRVHVLRITSLAQEQFKIRGN